MLFFQISPFNPFVVIYFQNWNAKCYDHVSNGQLIRPIIGPLYEKYWKIIIIEVIKDLKIIISHRISHL